MKGTSTSSDPLTDTRTAPRGRRTHLILLGFLAAVAGYTGIFLNVRLDSLFASYKDATWSVPFLTSERLHHLYQTRMRVVLLSVLGLCAGVFAQLGVVDPYIAKMSPIAKAGLLANIGPNGSRSSGAKVSKISECFLLLDLTSV